MDDGPEHKAVPIFPSASTSNSITAACTGGMRSSCLVDNGVRDLTTYERTESEQPRIKLHLEPDACRGRRRLSGLVDDGLEDLTADDGPEHKAAQTFVHH